MSKKSEKRFSPDLKSAKGDEIFYALTMFPYPSGYGLHAGHASNYTINDVLARYQRHQGKVVFNPIGFDSFGLPTENYAMKVGKPAYEVTDENINYFLKQIKAMDMSFDMGRVIATSRPDYYKWTQWIFQQLYKAGLVYRDELRVNWCPNCQTVLANDQVVEGACERCDTDIVQTQMPQWFIKITDYADRLLEDLDNLDWPEATKKAQRNWIGRSEGAEVDFTVNDTTISVFTTRPDTIYGVTALVLAPENTSIDTYIDERHREQVDAYRKEALAKTSVERQQDAKEKTGVFSGVMAEHPLTGEELPVWFADYVLPDYAHGAVMLVPAHDQRDFLFAKKFSLDIVPVIAPHLGEPQEEQEDSAEKIIAIVRDGDALLSINRGEELGGNLFVGGTIENGESPEECARREIAEETGYTDLTLVGTTGRFYNHYTAHSRGVNVQAPTIGLLFELEDTTQDEQQLTADEQGKFAVERLETPAVENRVNDPAHSFVYTTLIEEQPYTGTEGELINSDQFTGLWVEEAVRQITNHLEKNNQGRLKITYKLRDWSVSRQRYWGSPIPVYYDDDGNHHLIPEDELPVELPLDVEDYKPKGKSPLADHPTFPTYTDRHGNEYRRECDTLDTFMCSSFYFLRYVDPDNDEQLADPVLLQKCFPVDFYIGGKEHTVGHLLYSRFIHKFLYDQGYVGSPEPFQKLLHQGMVAGPDGRKMSKRWGNVIDPIEVIEEYGSDTVRTYLMFMGPIDQDKARDTSALKGVHKFLKRVEVLLDDDFLVEANETTDQNETLLHKTIKGVTEDMEKMKYNTVVSKLMIFINGVYDVGTISSDQFRKFAVLLEPFAPKLAAKIWGAIGATSDVSFTSRPRRDEDKVVADVITLPVQVNGKVRANIEVDPEIEEEEALAAAREQEGVKKYVDGKKIKKIIFVPGKILNIVI